MPRRTAPRSQSKSRSDAERMSLDTNSCLLLTTKLPVIRKIKCAFPLIRQVNHIVSEYGFRRFGLKSRRYELTKRLSASREKEVQQLLMHEELGDRKPSQFLRHLQHLAGPNIPEDFLKTIWTSRLPNSIQAVLAAQPTTPLATLAEVADRVNDIVPRTPVVASTSTSTQNTLDHMAKMISELTKQVQALTTHASRKPRPMSRGRDERKRSSSRSHSSYRKYPICWYHAKFGTTAKKCVKPCDYSAGNAPGSR
ncbi:uncharacterized protein LOC124542426 [Vanessa cardui]|uniref:uncharacterized protein LOC124542426 n=1 Tax=Vanessa cardui TaxID=171605 RepID=UPI001F131F75|nr:uncharacterized protein LOC124542426 [Vanessa cardui]